MYKSEEYESAEVDPVRYAIKVIEWYQLEIRSLRIPDDIYMDIENGQCILKHNPNIKTCEENKYISDLGFCQGSVGTTAIARIKQLAKLK